MVYIVYCMCSDTSMFSFAKPVNLFYLISISERFGITLEMFGIFLFFLNVLICQIRFQSLRSQKLKAKANATHLSWKRKTSESQKIRKYKYRFYISERRITRSLTLLYILSPNLDFSTKQILNLFYHIYRENWALKSRQLCYSIYIRIGYSRNCPFAMIRDKVIRFT